MSFVRNAWYVIAWSDEVGRDMLARTILDEPILLFRKIDGQIAAIHDLCPHRFAPLSMGQRIGDVVQCGYHGLQFDGSGRCIKNPQSGGLIVDPLHVRSYQVHEHHNLVWIWMGIPDKTPDYKAIPDFSNLTDSTRKTIKGYCKVNSDYRLLVDNLMDLGHFQYLHGGMAKIEEGFENVVRNVEQVGQTIFNKLLFPRCKATVLWQKGLPDPSIIVDQFNDIRWDPVGLMRNHVGVTPTGRPREDGVNHYGAHIVTPESESSCHYFYGSSRNYSQDDLTVDNLWRTWQQRALNDEDKPMVEGVQMRFQYAQKAGIKPVMLSSDGAAVRAQRCIEALTREQQTSV